MTLADLLLIITIILIAVVAYSYKTGQPNMVTTTLDSALAKLSALTKPTAAAPAPTATAPVETKAAAVVVEADKAEVAAAKENMEYFASQCSAESQLGPAVSPCECQGDSTFTYARSDYGPSADYTGWVMNQSIDPTVAANHREFISDRTGENASVNVLGRTYTPEDSHQSYTPPNTWIGIRGRPSLVPVCSPDQVNDVNFGYYPKEQKLKWDSTSTYEV
jgi:hypothetical protein